MKSRAIVICVILISFMSSCYQTIDVSEADKQNEINDSKSTSETISTPTNLVIYLTENVPSVTPTPRDVFETIIDYSTIPDEDSIIYYNYIDESLYLLPEQQPENRIMVIESWGELSGDGKYFSLFSDNTLIVFNMQDRSREEYLIDKEYCFDYSWFPSRDLVIFECSYSLYLLDLHSDQLSDFIIAQAGDAFLNPVVSPSGEYISYGYDSTSTLMQEQYEGIYISNISCVKDLPTCRENALGPFLSHSYTSSIIQSWSPRSEFLAVYYDHNLWIINPVSEAEQKILDSLDYIDGLAWHPSGQWILYSQGESIYKVSASGGEPILVTENAGYLRGWVHNKID